MNQWNVFKKNLEAAMPHPHTLNEGSDIENAKWEAVQEVIDAIPEPAAEKCSCGDAWQKCVHHRKGGPCYYEGFKTIHPDGKCDCQPAPEEGELPIENTCNRCGLKIFCDKCSPASESGEDSGCYCTSCTGGRVTSMQSDTCKQPPSESTEEWVETAQCAKDCESDGRIMGGRRIVCGGCKTVLKVLVPKDKLKSPSDKEKTREKLKNVAWRYNNKEAYDRLNSPSDERAATLERISKKFNEKGSSGLSTVEVGFLFSYIDQLTADIQREKKHDNDLGDLLAKTEAREEKLIKALREIRDNTDFQDGGVAYNYQHIARQALVDRDNSDL